MTEKKIDIRVPGAAYYEALDPLATDMPEALGLPTPRRVSRGKGATYFYDGLTLSQAREVAEYLIDHGTTLLGNTEPPERAALRACVAAGMKIRKAIQAERLTGAEAGGILDTATGTLRRAG